MYTIWELWDHETANIVDAYTSEAAALREVAAQVGAFGREGVETWSLLASTSDGLHKENVAHGAALADLALRARAGAAHGP